jgi:hypothetical protein
MKTLAIFLTAFIMWYLIFTLVSWDYNIGHWHWGARLMWLFFGTVANSGLQNAYNK